MYSLGVILYELLTGTAPRIRPQDGTPSGAERLRRAIEDEVPPPAEHLMGRADLPEIAARRRTSPPRLTAWAKGDIGRIAMRALERSPAQRYESVADLSRDVERFLNGETVEATPATAWHRGWKFFRRHPKAVAATLTAMVVLVAGVALRGWVEADRQREAADASAETARAERDKTDAALRGMGGALADAQRDAARAHAAEADAVRAKQESANFVQLLGDCFPEGERKSLQEDGLHVAHELARQLKAAAAKLDCERARDPRASAHLLGRLAQTLVTLGHPQDAVPLFARAQATRRRLLPAGDGDTLLGALALGQAYRAADHCAEALPLCLEAHAGLRPPPIDKKEQENDLSLRARYEAALCQLRLDTPKGMKELQAVLPLQRTMHGADSFEVIRTTTALGHANRRAGKPDAAVALFRRALELLRKKHPRADDHPDILDALADLAGGCRAGGQFEDEVRVREELVALRRRRKIADHPATLAAMRALAAAHLAAGRPASAVQTLEDAVAASTSRLGATHAGTFAAVEELAGAYLADGRPAAAVAALRAAHAGCLAQLGPADPLTVTALAALARAQLRAGEAARGLENIGRAYEQLRLSHGPSDSRTLALQAERARATLRHGPADRARALYESLAADCRRAYAGDPVARADALDRAGDDLLSGRQYAAAEAPLREALDLREKAHPDALATAETRSRLGAALLARGRSAEAEPLLLEAYRVMRNKEATLPAVRRGCLAETADRLVRLYAGTTDEEQLAKWRAERARHGPEVAPPPRRAK